MAIGERAFESPSAVGQYWLARSQGFVVESPSGRRVGEIERAAVDPVTGDGALVVVRRGVLGTRRETVSTDRVRLVLPWSETIVLGRASYPARRRERGRPRVPAGEHAVRWARGRARRSRGWSRDLALRARPHVLEARRAVAAEARVVRAYAIEVSRSAVPVARAVALAVARAVGELVAWLVVVTPVALGRVRVRIAQAWRRLDAAIEARRDPPQRDAVEHARVRRER